jgi:hypothetical protein
MGDTYPEIDSTSRPPALPRKEDRWLSSFRWARSLNIGPRDLDAKLALFGIDPARRLYRAALEGPRSSARQDGVAGFGP